MGNNQSFRRWKKKWKSPNTRQTRSSAGSQQSVQLSSEVSRRSEDESSRTINATPTRSSADANDQKRKGISFSALTPAKTLKNFVADSVGSASIKLRKHLSNKKIYHDVKQSIKLKDKLPIGDGRRRIEVLSAEYPWYRTVENDNGLFYHSFLFAYVEHIWLKRDENEVARLNGRFRDCLRDGFCDPSLKPNLEAFLGLLAENLDPESRPDSRRELLKRNCTWETDKIILALDNIVTTWLSRHRIRVFDRGFHFGNEAERLTGYSEIRAYRELTALSVALGVTIHVEVLTAHPPQSFQRPTYHGLGQQNAATASSSSSSSSSQPGETLLDLLYWSDGSSGKDCYDILYRSMLERSSAFFEKS